MKKLITLLFVLIPFVAYSECEQFQIIDHGDRTEVICNGIPPTASELRKREQDAIQMDREISEQLQAQKDAQKRNEDAIKLTRNDCTKTSECGPGRVCVGFVAFGVGVCKESAEATRIVEQAQRNADQSRANQIKSNQDYENYKINRKLDDIDRKLKTKY